MHAPKCTNAEKKNKKNITLDSRPLGGTEERLLLAITVQVT